MIIIRKDKMRLYKKLDQKFTDLFTKILNKLNKVRDIDLDSIFEFSKIAKRVLEDTSAQQQKVD